MPRAIGTVGQLLVNDVLPEDMRDYRRVITKKSLAELLSELAKRYPDRYRDISYQLGKIGRLAAYTSGGNSFGLEHMRRATSGRMRRQKLQAKLDSLLDDDALSDNDRESAVIKLMGKLMEEQQNEVFDEAMANKNPLAAQLLGAGRGNKMNLASLLASDGLYQDHRDRVIPIPVLRSYSQGLSPAEYWAGTYGARQGVMSVKFATQDAGFLCLLASTLVRMADGSVRRIDAIKPGDMVAGANVHGATFPVAVTNVFDNGLRDVRRYVFRNNCAEDPPIVLEATALHLVLGTQDQTMYGKLPIEAFESSAAWQLVTAAVNNASSGDRFYHLIDYHELGSQHTYDIEVNHSDHLFVLANGAIVSNSKQLNQVAHRSMVTALDRDKESETLLGLPVDVDDDDSEGALLAQKTGPYERNTVLTPKILRDLRTKGVKRLLVRSPAISGTPDGGLYARDVGVREYNRLPVRGEQVGLTAAQALSEPISQGQLSAKHTGGVAGASKAVSGFDYINQLVQVPKTFKGGAAHATVDGTVQDIHPAPAGGTYVLIDGEQHYIAAGYDPKVKKGDKVEAGDVLSDGAPNPAVVTHYKGIGEGRRYFINAFRQAIRDAGMRANRRNVELLARGLINHVRLTDEFGDFAPDDVVPYSALETSYKPRPGYQAAEPRAAVGRYLERPYLHYSIGTRIRPSMLADFQEFGIKSVDVHPDPPPFEPEMVRGMANLQHDPDWMTRMFGSGLKTGLLHSAQHGSTASATGTSFVAGRAKAVDFGHVGLVRTPKVLS